MKTYINHPKLTGRHIQYNSLKSAFGADWPLLNSQVVKINIAVKVVQKGTYLCSYATTGLSANIVYILLLPISDLKKGI